MGLQDHAVVRQTAPGTGVAGAVLKEINGPLEFAGPAAIADSLAGRYPEVKALRLPKNQGKGAAVRAGLAAATGEIILVQDADLEYDPADYAGLIRPILDGVTNVAYGSRWFNRHFHVAHAERFWFMAGNWVVTQAANLLYGAHVTDVCTCLKAFDARLLRSLPLSTRGFEFCAEVTALVRKRGEKIWETPIYYSPRTVAEGKKIRAADGLRLLWTLLRLRFSSPGKAATPPPGPLSK